MERNLLHKMFNGDATDNELTQIRRWVNESPQNRETFFRERTLFDALQLSDIQPEAPIRIPLLSRRKWVRSIAVAIIALCFLYNIPRFITEKSGREVAYHTIIVPAGQQVKLELADGTHVWLNALSELSYPVTFNASKREVRLKGEAFFDVAKDRNKKFIVHAGPCEVEVLGTEFNVESYSENEFSTALLRGSVKVTDLSQPNQSVVLEPNNTVRLDNGKLTVSPITDLNPYSWKSGLIIFKDMYFKTLMKKLEKSYGIHIVIENSTLDNYVCSGKFRISDGVEQVLRALQMDAHFTFERKSGTEIHIR